jgi:uncharacterized protein YyaL (SSP411 family)
VPRRIAALVVLVALVLAAVSLAHQRGNPATERPHAAAVDPGPPASYLQTAETGIARSRAWWDPSRHWYRQRLHGSQLATNWGIVHLFGATSALAIADPTPAHRAAVRAFAAGAERYWNPDLPVPGYGPSVDNRGATHRTWYDDEGWWGIAFYDAFRATGDRRYLASASRALTFLDSGWDPVGGGIYWDTGRTFKAGESLAGATLLAAYLYSETHSPRYLALVHKYVDWADAHFRSPDGLYYKRDGVPTPMPYVEGPMAVAFLVLCHSTGDRAWCAKGESLGARTAKRFPVLTMGPQYDSLYVRALIELYRYDGRRRWYDIAAAATDRALRNSRSAGGLYLRTWSGRPISSIGTDPGKLQTHAATTSVAAWMATAAQR